MQKIDQADLIALTGLQQDRSCPIAEQNAGRPVCVVDDRAHHVRADHQDLAVGAGLHKFCPDLERVDEAGARCGKVETPGLRRPDLVLNQARCRGEGHVRRYRGNNDGVYLGSVDAGLGQTGFSRLCGQVAGGNTFIDNVPFPDAGSFRDPPIVGFHHALQVGVGQQPGWDVGAYSRNLCANSDTWLQGKTQTNATSGRTAIRSILLRLKDEAKAITSLPAAWLEQIM